MFRVFDEPQLLDEVEHDRENCQGRSYLPNVKAEAYTQPVSFETKTNRDLVACVFQRLAPVSSICTDRVLSYWLCSRLCSCFGFTKLS